VAPAPEILIVEDDRDLAGTLEDLIRELGYRTARAHDGREALEILGQRTPSVMLIDLFMPGMGGIALLHAIKEQPRLRAIPKMVMTAANDGMIGVKEDVVVLYKPIDPDVLSDALARCLAPTA
jgi:CheY-like chemotaxis protein